MLTDLDRLFEAKNKKNGTLFSSVTAFGRQPFQATRKGGFTTYSTLQLAMTEGHFCTIRV